ncbi:hypothetical protein LSCM1_00078 [Leishmania martiniquensis]|uniref:J domain-containing protein n=1 Tax=Leishmania martiniquensis TaxID=1580590 RepID=A0A836GET7_9TRYP|nr:hypothetical protein LSCM1_00078 [Leishmania martiniquensis]
MLDFTLTIDARRTRGSSLAGGTPAGNGVVGNCGSTRGFYAMAPSTHASKASCSDSATPATSSPSSLTLEGGAAFARSSSAQYPRCALRCLTASNLLASTGQAMKTVPIAGLASGASPSFSLRGVGCIPRLTKAVPSRRTPPARGSSASSLSHAAITSTRPQLNNYLSGQPTASLCSTFTHGRLWRAVRCASAPHERTAAALSASGDRPSASRSRGGPTADRGREVAAAFAGCAARGEGPPEGARSLAPAAPFCASAATTNATNAATAPVTSVRPALPLHLPSHRGEELYERTQAHATADVDKSAATHSRLTTFARRSASAAQRAARHCPPPASMRRSSTMIRPMLLTKDTSRAHLGVASGIALSACVAGATRARGSFSLPSSMSPDGLLDVTGESSSEAGASPAVATASSPYYSRPSPPQPPPRPARHRRSRRTSLISMNSNSPTSVLRHEQDCSLDQEAASALNFFSAMPDLSAAAKEVEEGPCSSSRDEDLTMGATASLLDEAGNTTFAVQSSSSEAAATATWEARRRGSGGSAAGSRSHDRTHYAVPLLSQLTNEAAARAAGSSGVVLRLRERGNAHFLREEFELAIANYTEAIRLAPGYEALWSNRACAFLLSFRYLPAVVDCLYVLYLRPGHAKACWRAAKAYAASYRMLEAKKYYQLAQQACDRHCMWQRPPSVGDETAFPTTTCAGRDGGEGPSAFLARSAADRTADGGAEVFSQDGSRAGNVQRDRQVMAFEAAALEVMEIYWQHLRHERWADALAAMDKVLNSVSYQGPTAVSWQALRLEALLHLRPKEALAEAEALYRAYPGSLELYPVLAKAIFYDMHDAAATRRCLALLDEAAEKRRMQNRLLKVNVHYCAIQLRERLPDDTGEAAALQMEAWAKQNYLREDSRTAELRHTIEKFARHRDAGNAAYEVGDWQAAASAYTRCLETDRLNSALLAAVYCNRTAVYMQAGRWLDALSDADLAVSLSPQYATAYARRGRVRLYLLAQEYGEQRTLLGSRHTAQWTAAMKQRLQGYADTSVTDLMRAVELSPTMEHKAQLQQALTQRQAIQASLKSASEIPKASMPFSSATSSKERRHHGEGGHPSSSSADEGRAGPAAIHEVTEQLKLLGLSIVASSAPGEFGRLPEPKLIAKAYREAALRWHPDKWVTATPNERQQAEQHFKSICVAYQALRERSGAVF